MFLQHHLHLPSVIKKLDVMRSAFSVKWAPLNSAGLLRVLHIFPFLPQLAQRVLHIFLFLPQLAQLY
jgi:hypothetical protein